MTDDKRIRTDEQIRTIEDDLTRLSAKFVSGTSELAIFLAQIVPEYLLGVRGDLTLHSAEVEGNGALSQRLDARLSDKTLPKATAPSLVDIAIQYMKEFHSDVILPSDAAEVLGGLFGKGLKGGRSFRNHR